MSTVTQKTETFTRLDTTQAPRQIVREVLSSEENVLLVPPRLHDSDFELTPPPDETDVNVGLFTSGSTGKPKLIWNRRSHIRENGRVSAGAFSVNAQMKLQILASPWHVAGLSWALMAEENNIDYRMKAPRIAESDQWVGEINAYQPDMLFTVPTVLRYLYESKNWFVPRIAFGGASILQEDYKELAPHTQTLYQAYGQTEAGGLIAVYSRDINTEPESDEHIRVGRPPENVMIHCEGKKDVPGPILVQSPSSIVNGWYDTGDLGYFDDDQQLHVTGRNDQRKGNCNMITAVTEVVHK